LENDREHCGEVLSNSIAAIAHLSKGFAKPSNEVRAVLVETLPITMRVLEVFSSDEQVRNKSMILLQRMILCVESQVLPFMPRFLFLLITDCNSDDISFVSQVLNQLCIRFKQDAVQSIDDALLPFLEKCHSLIATADNGATSDTPTHLDTEQLSVKKLSYAVLQNIVQHDVTAVLISPKNVGNLEAILRVMGEGACCVNDAIVKRTCLRFFRDLIEQWAGENGVFFGGLVAFMQQVLIPGVVRSMLDPQFDERDASQAKNIHELAKVLLAVKSKTDHAYFQQHFASGLDVTGDSLVDIEKSVTELLVRARISSLLNNS
jgi:exportin-T